MRAAKNTLTKHLVWAIEPLRARKSQGIISTCFQPFPAWIHTGCFGNYLCNVCNTACLPF